MHGFGCWFDVSFVGSDSTTVLTTAPDQPLTHWYQCRLLLGKPLAVNEGQVVKGAMQFDVNERFSYTIGLKVELEGCGIIIENVINLHDQAYSHSSTS